MENDVQSLIISGNMTIVDAMSHIDQAGKGIAFVCNDRDTLLATLSDGDIRRYIIQNGNLSNPVSMIANYNFFSLPINEKNKAEKMLQKLQLKCIPILDAAGRLISAHFWDNTEAKKNPIPLKIPVIIQAGGKGMRLYPYTKILPKPLIPIGDLTITEHIMQRFIQNGCQDFFMIINHKKNMIKAYFSDILHKYNMSFVEETTPLGTGGGLKMLENTITTPFFLSNCDILIDDHYDHIYNSHKEKKNLVTMICAAKQIIVPYGTIDINGNGEVINIKEKPAFSFMVNTGMYLFEPGIFQYIPANQFIHITDVIQIALNNGEKIGIYPISENQWSDMGQLNELGALRQKMGLS